MFFGSYDSCVSFTLSEEDIFNCLNVIAIYVPSKKESYTTRKRQELLNYYFFRLNWQAISADYPEK